MTEYTPEVRLVGPTGSVISYNSAVEYDITLTAGRSSITEQPQPSYMTYNVWVTQVKNKSFMINVGDLVGLQIKNSSGTWVSLYKGQVSDVELSYREWGNLGWIIQYSVTVTSQLAQLNRRTVGHTGYPKQKDGERVKAILTDALLTSWSEMGNTTTWQTVANVSWANFNADIANLIASQIDTGIYELTDYNGGPVDAYTLATEAANSGRGILYALPDGTLNYDDYMARFSATPINLTSAHVDPHAIKREFSLGTIVNDVEVTYRAGSETTRDEQSIATYGQLVGSRTTTLHNASEAATQARDFLLARAYPQDPSTEIEIQLQNPNISDAIRNALITTNLGTYIYLFTSLPTIMGRAFYGYVENYTWQFSKGKALLTMGCSSRYETYPSYVWPQIPATYTWTSYGIANPTQDWTQVT